MSLSTFAISCSRKCATSVSDCVCLFNVLFGLSPLRKISFHICPGFDAPGNSVTMTSFHRTHVLNETVYSHWQFYFPIQLGKIEYIVSTGTLEGKKGRLKDKRDNAE